MPQSAEILDHIDTHYGIAGVTAMAVADDQVVVLLPKEVTDLTALLTDLDELFGATCDLEQTEEGASLRVWHAQAAPAAPPPAACRPATVGLAVLGAATASALLLAWL